MNRRSLLKSLAVLGFPVGKSPSPVKEDVAQIASRVFCTDGVDDENLAECYRGVLQAFQDPTVEIFALVTAHLPDKYEPLVTSDRPMRSMTLRVDRTQDEQVAVFNRNSREEDLVTIRDWIQHSVVQSGRSHTE